MISVLITGALGMLGHQIIRNLSDKYHLSGWDIANLDETLLPCKIENLNLSNFEATKKALHALKPQIVIHTAAMINVDQCELEPQKAHQLNAGMTEHLVRIVNNLGGRLVYISTDAVFDGNKTGAYNEEDAVHPLNNYGHSKLAGEQAVLSSSKNNTVIRTNIYGWNIQNKSSSAENIVENLQLGKALNMFTDLRFSPIYVGHFVQCLRKIIEGNLSGLWHIAGGQHCSKYDFAMELAKVFELDNSVISQGKLKEANLKARRNPNMCLDSSKFTRSTGMNLPNLIEGLLKFKHDGKYYGKITDK